MDLIRGSIHDHYDVFIGSSATNRFGLKDVSLVYKRNGKCRKEYTRIAEPELKGKTYHSAKQYFNRTYIPLADGIILFK